MGGLLRQNLDFVPDLHALCERWPADFPYLLESNAPAAPGNHHSILLLAYGEALECGPSRPERAEFLDDLVNWFETEKVDADGALDDVPFRGGWFLYFGYEMGMAFEPTLSLPTSSTGLPDAFAQRCPGAIIVQHDLPNQRAIAIAENREVLSLLLDRISAQADDDGRSAIARNPKHNVSVHMREDDPERFCDGVRRIHEYLLAGDVFQVNLSRGWSAQLDLAANPVPLYRALGRKNPAPFSGIMRRGPQTILSSSPERLIEIRKGAVQTRPIAGTRRRVQDRARDRALLNELIANAKERAEHIMLIDLERNDLGRVCVPGTVEVSELMVVESHAHVHHIVSNVRGRLNPDATPIDAIRAVFPGGTITGCPKVRCMEIIAELEQQGRSYYTGSMGYLNRDGDLDMNILIRSMMLEGEYIQFRTGAGIVADSEPERELEETREKALGLLLAIEDQAQGLTRASTPE